MSFPFAILHTMANYLHLASYPRQIVNITPKNPAVIVLPEKEKDREVSVTRWVEENCPSLRGTFTPSWWLPKWVRDAPGADG